MCEFCVQHGEGEKWYLQAKNYAEELAEDPGRRRFVEEFVTDTDRYREAIRKLEALEQAPRFVKRAVSWFLTRRSKRDHFGQVVPIEDLEGILGIVNSVVRMACLCRHVLTGREGRYCYGLSISPDAGRLVDIATTTDGSFLAGPDAAGLERLSAQEALAAMREHEGEGLCHTVWTFKTPFIGAVCNCDRTDCLAMRISVTHEVPIMFRAEWVAQVDGARCAGCRECMKACQFGALGYSAGSRQVEVDGTRCYGCGVCRAGCGEDAIRLLPRDQVPVAARRWL